MDKKGFTLIEIMAVIVVLGLLIAIITPVVSNLLKDSEDTLHDEQIDMVVKASQKYMIEHSELLPEGSDHVIVYIDDLINGGIIDNDKVIDPKTKEELDGCVVVTYNDSFNQYEYNYDDGCSISKPVFVFDYTGEEETFEVPISGKYSIEVWGAQGGNAISSVGGYGAYSVGTIYLNQSQKLFVYVGGKGENSKEYSTVSFGGYNGGGDGKSNYDLYFAGGGGATHISFASGLLSTLSDDLESILIVAGGGGGAGIRNSSSPVHFGGSGGGGIGNAGYSQNDNNLGAGGGGSQYSGGTSTSLFTNSTDGNGGVVMSGGFGFGGSGNLNTAYPKSLDSRYSGGSGGGGGYYGGASGYDEASGAGGGSGYIGNALVINASMFCYDCAESNQKSMQTISTTGTSQLRNTETCPNGYSEEAISKCAKKGNGYARISYLGV